MVYLYVLITRCPAGTAPGVAVPGVPARVVMTMYCAPGVPTPRGMAVIILAPGLAPTVGPRGEAITIVCLPAAVAVCCAPTAVTPGLATATPGVPAPSTEPVRPLMIVAPPGNV